MIDDIRDHNPTPTREEAALMEADPVGIVVSVMAVAAVALAIGTSTSTLLGEPVAMPTVAAAQAEH